MGKYSRFAVSMKGDSFFRGSQGLLNFIENVDVPSVFFFLKLDVPKSQVKALMLKSIMGEVLSKTYMQ